MPKDTEQRVRYRVTIEDLETGAVTIRVALVLKAAIVLAQDAHVVPGEPRSEELFKE